MDAIGLAFVDYDYIPAKGSIGSKLLVRGESLEKILGPELQVHDWQFPAGIVG